MAEAAPPVEHGRRLASFARGASVELRVNLDEFNGCPYVALRVWECNRSGQWWPVKGKGVSIRLAEVADLAEVLGGIAP